MASTLYDYRYYREGRYLAILQRSSLFTYTPRYKIEDGVWVTPTVSDSSAIAIRYAISPTHVTSSTDTISNEVLGRALIHYLKYKIYDGQKDYNASNKEYGEFKRLVMRNQRNKDGLLARVVIPNGINVVK